MLYIQIENDNDNDKTPMIWDFNKMIRGNTKQSINTFNIFIYKSLSYLFMLIIQLKLQNELNDINHGARVAQWVENRARDL